MMLGYIKNYIHTFTKQMQELVGTLNGIDQNPVNLQNINIINITIGIVTVGINLTKKKDLNLVKLENYL
uniref:2OG-Fe(II) oxygenase superfamily like protein n=1 Tax=uncultured marine virus TaxID=186617 RepID=A0A0F7LB71_9VIRU|nr:2OG-Fe(II) oxygenase superfamily like protein [uncultured marine virus]